MSTFDGVIKEYPLISIDRFTEKNYASTIYFLSHCHKDHMRGLNDSNFFNLLTSRGFSKIYVSDVSCHLLQNDCEYEHLTGHLVVLPIEHPTLIILYDQSGKAHSRVVVTLLTAGHCPGSVMFLIEGENGTVLYTGDFRLPIGSSARVTHMHDDNGRVKPLESLYVDTTFCNEKSLYIPSREECLNAVVSLVEPWLCNGPNYIVCIFCPYQYAYEFIFVELYKRLGVKTHVTEEVEKKYLGIKSVEDAVTSIAHEARIHACANDKSDLFKANYYSYQTPCGFFSSDNKPVRVRKIKPSAMFFQKQDFSSISKFDTVTNMYRVCYSTHPSLSEVRDMISYLKPKRVFPNVVANQTEKEILDLIFSPYSSISVDIKADESSLSPLGKLKSSEKKEPSNTMSNSLPFYDECYEIATEQKSRLDHSSEKSSAISVNEDKSVETDFENTDKQNKLLKEEMCFSQNVKGSESRSEAKISDLSPLKWQNPIVSSDDEAFGHSSSFEDSLKDKSDSDIVYGTSEENNAICFNEEKTNKENASAIETTSKDIDSHNTEYQNENSVNHSSVVLKSCIQINVKGRNFDSNTLYPCLKGNEASKNLVSCSVIKSSEVTSKPKLVCETLQYLEENKSNKKRSPDLCQSLFESNQNPGKKESSAKASTLVNGYESQVLHKLSPYNKFHTSHCSANTQIKCKKRFQYVKKITSSDDSEEDCVLSFKHIIKLPESNEENAHLKLNNFTSDINELSLKFSSEVKKSNVFDGSKSNPNNLLVNVNKINSPGNSGNDNNLSFKYVSKLPGSDKENACLEPDVNKLNSKCSSEFQKHGTFNGSKSIPSYTPVNKVIDCNNLTAHFNSLLNKQNKNLTTEFKALEKSHVDVTECSKDSEKPKLRTDFGRYSDVNSCNQVKFNLSKVGNSPSVSDSKLMALYGNKIAPDKDFISDSEYKEGQKKKFTFKKFYSKNFESAVNSVLSSKNETFEFQSKDSSFKLGDKRSDKPLASSNAQNTDIEIIDLSSDSSSEEIFHTYSEDSRDKISSNIQMNVITNTSSKVDLKHKEETNSNSSEKMLLNMKFSTDINDYKKNSEALFHNKKTSNLFQKAVNQNLFGHTSSTTTSYFKHERTLNYKAKASSESILPHQNSGINLEKYNMYKDNTSTNSASDLKIEVQEINSSSDLEDSPSLIAPIVKVSKSSTYGTHFNSSNNLDPKRFRHQSEEEFSLNVTKQTKCDGKLDYHIPSNDLGDSESTPEDLIENANGLSSSSLSHTRVIPEFILDDDS